MNISCSQRFAASVLLGAIMISVPLRSAVQGNDRATFYVAPNGNDAWSGKFLRPNRAKTDGPFATLTRARDAVRELRKSKKVGNPRIIVRGGDYFLDAPLHLTAQDSGLTVAACKGERPRLNGGRRITDWKRDGDRFWCAELPGVREGRWNFRMLVVNGRVCPRARLPENGCFTHETTFNVPWMCTTDRGWQRKPTPEELTTMRYRPGDLGEWLDINNAELTVYHVWDESLVGIAAHDTKTRTLRFSIPAGHPPGGFGVQKYVVWNIREGMKSPGQWYLDRSAGKLVYWPLPGEDMTQAVAIAPTTETILAIQGTTDAPVANVTIRGLDFSVTNTPLKAGGFGANVFDGAVQVVHTTDCRLLDLTIKNTGGQGIKGWMCKGLRVENCEFLYTGACGVRVDGVDSTLTNNYFHHIGITYPSAIALWISGQRMQVNHNEIHDTPYTAIAAAGNDHSIESNLIYRAMQVLHDGAGIYINFCKNIVVRGNIVRDIVEKTGVYGAFAFAYYLDEQAEGCIVEGNLSERVKSPSHNHMAKKNTIRDNVFIAEGDAILTFPKCSDFTFARNIVHASGKISIRNPEAITTHANNLYFSGQGAYEGIPEGSVKSDPQFISLTRGDYRFRPRSPAVTLGLRPIDVRAAGRRR